MKSQVFLISFTEREEFIMEDYKKPYFTVFAALCDTIDTLEQLLRDGSLSSDGRSKLESEIRRLKAVHQKAEDAALAGCKA